MKGPLKSLKIVEFSGLGPGPLAGQLLADLGADVITVDKISAKVDPTEINRRNKRSIALNLKSKARIKIVKKIYFIDPYIKTKRGGGAGNCFLGPTKTAAGGERLSIEIYEESNESRALK